jgi:hypothetical protein
MMNNEKVPRKIANRWILAITIGFLAVVAVLTACSRQESAKEEKKPATAEKSEKKEAPEKKEEPGVVVLSQENKSFRNQEF